MYSREQIKKDVKRVYDDNNFIVHKTSRSEAIDRDVEYTYLILTTGLKFIDIAQQVREERNYKIELNKTETDLIQFNFKNIALSYKIDLEDIIDRYSDSYEEVEERMFFRVELYKQGWDKEQIENYIYKYLLKEKYTLNDEYNIRLECLYTNIFSKMKIARINIKNKIGRPKLPEALKEIISKKHNQKSKDAMRVKYEYCGKYTQLKNNLLTKEEFDDLQNVITNTSILDKLKFFCNCV